MNWQDWRIYCIQTDTKYNSGRIEMNKFIVIEGLDGTGKTTQIKNLAEYLRSKGEKVHITCEPTETPTGRLIRRVLSGEIPSSPWATAALFLADRINHNTDEQNGIKKYLNDGYTVISDRYYYSTFAYQGCETDLEWTMDIHYNCPELVRPDMVIYLTMPVKKCLERIRANRPESALEIYENETSLQKTSEQFDRVFDLIKDRENIVYIDASSTVGEVAEAMIDAVKKAVDLRESL